MPKNRFFKTMLLPLAIIAWAIYAVVFLILKRNPTTSLVAGIFSLVGQTSLDLIAAILVARLFVIYNNRNIKKAMLLFFISFFSAILADGIYNVEINLLHFEALNTRMILFFDIPFLAFLFFQLMAFGYIIISSKTAEKSKRKAAYIPYITASFLIFITFMFGISWKIEYFSIVGFFQVIDTIFEAVGFTWAIICLARANTWTIRFIAIGYLFIVSSDLIIRYHVISGVISYLNVFELFWVLGLLFMCIGFFIAIRSDGGNAFNLLSINSIQSHLSIWMLMLWLISALLFTLAYYIFTPNINNDLEQINRNLLSIIIPFSVLAIVCSNYIANKISYPLLRIENIINQLMGSKKIADFKDKRAPNNHILEFTALENFVSKAFDLYNTKHEMKMECVKIATQVAHDIRSPLTAISIAVSDIASIPENQRIIIKSASQRINDIANSLLSQYVNTNTEKQNDFINDTVSSELIYFVLENIVSEKNYEYRGKPFNIILDEFENSYACFSNINLGAFKRILSNLINNSIEALNSDGLVSIRLNSNSQFVEITIEDNGCGIAPDILPKITHDGFSHGKKKGTGCGLFHAKQYIEKISGSLTVSSEVGVGTKVAVKLLRSEPPKWFCENIPIYHNAHIVILDDDPSIHAAWAEKFSRFLNVTFSHFITAADLIAQSPLKATLYLVDYELLAEHKNGLDVIEYLHLNHCAFLVTSCFEDTRVRRHCEALGVKIIPKPYVQFIPIIIAGDSNKKKALITYDLIFLDDATSLTEAWEMVALSAGKRILTCNKIAHLEMVLENIDPATPIYVDSELGGKIKGEQYAESLFHRGFKELYLATGHRSEYFGPLPWIKGIVGKEPPFDSGEVIG